jgi:DNA-binding Xre family transcriptional regulator
VGQIPHSIFPEFLDLFLLKVSIMGKGPAPDYFLQSLGANLLKTREAKGLSLRDMAALCKVDSSDIAKMEKGEPNFTMLTLKELCKALGVHPRDLFDFEILPDD